MLRRLSTTVVFALSACVSGSENPGEGSGVPEASQSQAAEAAAEAPRTAAEDRPVVVFLGTSLTAGLGLYRDDDTFVARLAEMADSAGLPFRAVNAGVSGETSAGGLRRLDWVLREPLDALVLELGANDGLRGQAPRALAQNLAAIVDETRRRYPGTPVLLAGMEAPPNLGDGYTEAFREVFVEVARESDVTLVPFLLEGVAGVAALNQSDGIHPTPEGHRRIARTVWPYLEPILRNLHSTGAS